LLYVRLGWRLASILIGLAVVVRGILTVLIKESSATATAVVVVVIASIVVVVVATVVIVSTIVASVVPAVVVPATELTASESTIQRGSAAQSSGLGEDRETREGDECGLDLHCEDSGRCAEVQVGLMNRRKMIRQRCCKRQFVLVPDRIEANKRYAEMKERRLNGHRLIKAPLERGLERNEWKDTHYQRWRRKREEVRERKKVMREKKRWEEDKTRTRRTDATNSRAPEVRLETLKPL
jgi:hypothetical protein